MQELLRLKSYINSNSLSSISIKQIKNGFEALEINKHIKARSLSLSTYYRVITGDKYLNMSYKRSKRYSIFHDNDINTKAERRIFSRRFLFLHSLGYEFIFIDETGLNLNFRPAYGYSEKNKPLRLGWISSKSVNYSFLGAISKHGLVGYRVIKGGTTGTDFYNYLLEIIEVMSIDTNNTVFVFDNLPAHKLKAIYSVMRRKINILFIAKYSPMWNPIEYIFSLMKRRMKTKCYENVNDLLAEVGEFFAIMDEERYYNIFKHCARLMKAFINGEIMIY